jgi:fluoroquinolone transport system permease protein
MNKLLVLIQGEFQRFTKYHVTTISFLVAAMWFLLLYFIDDQDLFSTLLPFVIVIDSTMMSMIFIGSVMFFEKSESTISTLLVTPVSSKHLILSKTIANTIHSTLSALLIVLVFFFVKQVEIQFVYVLIALVVGISFHSLLGFAFSYHSKDFTSMLVNVMIYFFIFGLPSVLRMLNIFFTADIFEYVFMLSPTEAAMQLIKVAFGAEANFQYLFSMFYMIIGGVLLYIFYVLPKFKSYAIKQSGV